MRFNNHKGRLNRYGKGQQNIAGEHLYAHFLMMEIKMNSKCSGKDYR